MPQKLLIWFCAQELVLLLQIQDPTSHDHKRWGHKCWDSDTIIFHYDNSGFELR